MSVSFNVSGRIRPLVSANVTDDNLLTLLVPIKADANGVPSIFAAARSDVLMQPVDLAIDYNCIPAFIL